MNHKLEVDGIFLEFGNRKILSDIYFKCETGNICGILGRNGQGKSCLMNIVYGSLKVESKSIRFDNNSIFKAYKRPDLITYLPQFNFIPKSLTLKRIFSDFDLDITEFLESFPDFKIKAKQPIREFSGGQRRIVEVYAIIKSKSLFSMLDEPFSHIMPIQIEKFKQILKKEKEKKGFLITDHMYRHIVDLSDNLYILKEGKTYLTKESEDLQTLGYVKL
ncbi:MAG: ATP-binding cassette domain-containing protein [Bacteroidales bacterium]|nr:ATP-binding cassette domain-containing protein [Bacteroidales bacterium]NLO72334.1 ATP-binding cassette domain-containing protein [Porphyromonadaceae bacterium]